MRGGGREGGGRETESKKTLERVKQADKFINFKSCQQCRPVGDAFVIRLYDSVQPSYPCLLRSIPFPASSRGFRSSSSIAVLRCATYNFLWSFAAYRSDSMIGIYNNLRSDYRFTARSPQLQWGWREGELHFPGFISSPDYRRPWYEDPIIESQRFSFLLRYLRLPRGREERQLVHYCYCASWLVPQRYNE